MNAARKAFEDFILDMVEQILPNGGNKEIYQEYFASASDKDIEDLVKKLETGESVLPIQAPILRNQKLSIERNLAIAKKLNYNFFQKLWIEPSDGKPEYLTPIPYMVLDLPVRRQAQVLVKKISIPENNKTVDDLTGQPTGDSAGSKISYPETQVLASLQLYETLNEFLKFRGGDIDGFNAMNKMISRSGGVSQKIIEPYASGVESTKTLHAIFTAMHLDSSLLA